MIVKSWDSITVEEMVKLSEVFGDCIVDGDKKQIIWQCPN